MNSPSIPPLISNAQFTVHGQGSSLWYALQSPDKRFIRLGRKEYLIASAIDGQRTAPQVVAAINELEPALPCSAEEVQQVSGWLANMGLLSNPEGTTKAASPQPSAAFNPVYFKLPLIAGQRLESWSALVAPLLNWPVLVVVGAVWILGGASVLGNWEMLARTTSELFVADRWLWWCLAWLLLKTAHELGHAVMAVRIGSQIRSAGISFIFITPVPFVDLSDLWAIPNRWHRGLACAGGMLVEMTLAAVAALVAVSTEHQGLQYFCCAIATLGTVTTLVVNASPFIRFDGYFILSDLLNYPNLYTDAQLAAKRFLVRCMFPWRTSSAPRSAGLVVYGLACYQYRLTMMLSLVVGTILAFQGVGLVLVAWGAYAMLMAPWLRARSVRRAQQSLATQGLAAQAASTPQDRPDAVGARSGQAWISSYRETLLGAALVTVVAGLVATLPTPFQPACPGTIALRQPHVIRAETDGFLVAVLVPGNGEVLAGDVIARLSNPDLESELALKSNELAQLNEKIVLKRAQGHLAELQAAQAQRESLLLQVQQLEARVGNLCVRSPRAGQLVRNELSDQLGLFLTAGQPLAMVGRLDDLEVVASVSQAEVARWRAAEGSHLATHISGGPRLTCALETVEPRAQDRLQEPLLAACYGGPLAVEPKLSEAGEEDLRLHQPRFDARLRLTTQGLTHVTPGQMVWVRTPGQSASLWHTLSDWTQQKWRQLVRENSARE
jgi:putative peptide zinc metalloprotease protein